ncbi:MAG: hypothetical protein ACJ76S_01085 [Solirubrobacteraceae bacterium]
MSPRNYVSRGFVALLLGSFALTLAACGGEDPQKLIDETFSAGKNVHSGKVSVGLSATPQGSAQASQPVSLRINGPFESQGKGNLPKFDLGLSVSTSGRSFSAAAVSTGQAGFVKLGGSAYQLRDDIFAMLKRAYSQAQAQKGGSTQTTPAALGVTPRTWLRDAKNEGSEDVAGTDTAHVSAKIDVPKMLGDLNRALAKVRAKGLPQASQLPQSITPQQQKRISDAIRGATFDFWTGKDDKILRRLVIKLNFRVPPSEQASARGVTGGRLAFDFQISDLNRPQQVSTPANPRPFNELGPAVRSLVTGGQAGAGAGGAPGAGASGAGAPSGGAPSPAAQQAYIRCIQQAGGDVAKAQRCAALAGR